MASQSKKSKVPTKKAKPVPVASKKSKDSKGKASLKPVPKTKNAPSKAVKAPVKAAAKSKTTKSAPPKASTTKGKPKIALKPTKSASKVSAKPALKAKPTKVPTKKTAPLKVVSKGAAKIATKSVKKATKVTKANAPAAKSVSKKVAPKTAVASKAVAKAPISKPSPKPTSSKPAPKSAAPAKGAVKVPAKPASVKAPAKAPVAKIAPDPKPKAGKIDLFKGPFFQEVAVGSPAARKNKAPQPTASPLRKPKGEESHDELIARIERELLTVRMTSRKVQREQVCTKCCINPVEPGYMVDRDTGYCLECALVLGLGHTREARQQNFHPSLMKSEDEEAGSAPELPE